VDYSYQPDEAYTYDANGNRTNPGYVTGKNNRLLSDGKFNYEYDDEGNVIRQTDILTGEVTAYTWDYRNRLTNVTRNGASVGTYDYDIYDQRIGKTTATGTNRFVYGQNQNISLEFDGSGALTNRYLHGNSIDAILADEANGAVGWTLTDNLGTVRDVVDGTGARQNHFVYDSFGNVTSESNPSFDTRFTFTGREFDAETGNYDYRSRPFNPRSGRFIEEDAISFDSADVNLYRYVWNSSSNLIDPLGDRGYRPRSFPTRDKPQPITIPGSRPNPVKQPINPNRDITNDGGLVDPNKWIYIPILDLHIPTNVRPYQPPAPQPLPEPNSKPKRPPKPSPVSPEPNVCPKDCVPLTEPPIYGGSYRKVFDSIARKTPAEINHMPAWTAIKRSGIQMGQVSNGRDIAPAICMNFADHKLTRSNFFPLDNNPLGLTRKTAIDYTNEQQRLLSQRFKTSKKYIDNFLAVQQLDINDVQSIAPGLYSYGIRQMRNHTLKLAQASPELFAP
jgi:RHS repeat-associated protein